MSPQSAQLKREQQYADLSDSSDTSLPYDLDNGGFQCPVWSPDETQIVFNGTENEITYLAVLNVNDGGVKRVYEVKHDADILNNIYFPEWVLYSNQLSFGFLEAERRTGLVLANDIRSVSLDDGEVVTMRDDIGLTDEGGSQLYIGRPVPNYTPFAHNWSPDGKQLALALYNWRTSLMGADGSNLHEILTQWANGEVDWSPDGSTVESLAWSPDGSEIAYSVMLIDVGGGVFKTVFSVSVVDTKTGDIRELVRTTTFAGRNYPYNISCVDWWPTELASWPHFYSNGDYGSLERRANKELS